MMAPKEFLERLNAHTEEEQIKIMTNILKWADETQIARQEAEMYKRTADKLSDQIVQLKVDAQVAARMQPGAVNADPALKEENEKLRQEIERLKADSGDTAGWAVQKQQYEDRIKMLESQLDFQTNRANGLAESVQAEHEKYEAEHATCEGLAAQLRKLNDEIAQPSALQTENDTLKKKIDAHILANRELQEKIKGYEKEIKNAAGFSKKINDLEEELRKKENELKKQVAATAKEAKRVAEWEEECKRLQGIIDLEHEVSAQKRAIREAKTTGAAMRLPGEAVSMQGVGGTKELPKTAKSPVPHMFATPVKGSGAARQAAAAPASATELENAKKRINELQEQLVSVIEEREDLKEQLQNSTAAAAPVNAAPAEGAPAADNSALADENAVLKKQIEELRKKSADLGELDSLKAVNATQKMQLEKLVKEKETLDVKVKELTDEVNRFKSDSADSQTLAAEKKRLIEENEKLRKQVETFKNEVEDLKKQLAEKDKQLAGFLKEVEVKKAAEEAERAAANSTYEMRMSTLTSEVEKHDAKYLSTNSGFEGRIRIKANAPRKKSYFVLVDGQVFPNPYLFREMTTGKQSYHTLQQLKTLFDVEGLDNESMTYRLVSVKPAVVFVPDNAATNDTYELKEKGKLKVEKQV